MSASFGEYHPLAALCYYIAVVILAAVIRSPLFLLSALGLVALVNVAQDGGRSLKRYLKAYLAMALAVALLNPLFSHRGATVLFYLGENAFTLEAVVYGLTAGMSLLVIVWVFVSFNLIITGDKFLFLFGRVARQSALVAMMALGFIPRLRERLDELQLVLRARGAALADASLRERARLLLEMVGALTAWTLEDGAQLAQSMTARGYGVSRRRTSFARYRWRRRDSGFVVLLALLMAAVAVLWPRAAQGFALYPRLAGLDWGAPVVWLCFGAYCAVLALPLLAEAWAYGRYSLWQRRQAIRG